MTGPVPAPLTAAAEGRGWTLDRELVAGMVAGAPSDRLLFVLADADDWPRQLYERLGFAGVGERIGATRAPRL